MVEVNKRLLSHIHTGTGKHQDFDPSKLPEHLRAMFYTWTAHNDSLHWSPNATSLFKALLPQTERAYNALVETGLGPSRREAIAADASIRHERGMPYQINYGLRLSDRMIVAVEDRGRWFPSQDGKPLMAHGSITITEIIDPSLLPVQTKTKSEFLSTISRYAETRGTLRTTGMLALSATCNDATNSGDVYTNIHEHPRAPEIFAEIVSSAKAIMRHNDCILAQPNGSVLVALVNCSEQELPQAAERLRHCMEDQLNLRDGDKGQVCIKIGCAHAPAHGSTALQLLKHAEEALASIQHTNESIKIFNAIDRTYQEMEKSLATFLSATALLSADALDKDLILAKRPLLDAGTRLPVLHLTGPGRRDTTYQVKLAEDLRLSAEAAGLSEQLDRQLLHLACADLYANEHNIVLLPISASTLRHAAWPITLAENIGANSSVASRLVIGVFERDMALEPDFFTSRMHSMKALGIGVALLDVGAGFMTCEQIEPLPIDLVTLDGALTQNIAATTDNRFYARTLIFRMQRQNIAVAATWVEDERTASLLDEWGVEYLEGRLRRALPQQASIRLTA